MLFWLLWNSGREAVCSLHFRTPFQTLTFPGGNTKSLGNFDDELRDFAKSFITANISFVDEAADMHLALNENTTGR